MTATPQFAHDDRFVEPFANRPHTVLGTRLFPFSLWTQFNLELVQSPFLLHSRAPTLHDLWVAVRCASTPWTPEHYVPDLGVAKPRSLRGLLWLLRLSRYSFRMEVAKFNAYLADFAPGPKVWSNSHKGEREQGLTDVDENLNLASLVEHETGWEPRIVWTMPLGQLRWRHAMIVRAKGAELRFWTLIDDAIDADYKAKQATEDEKRIAEMIATMPAMTRELARKLLDEEKAARRHANLQRAHMKAPVPPRPESP